MNSQCYTPRASQRSPLIGGLFTWHNGDSRLVPDHCLVKAELLSGSRLLRLNYSYCIIEVAGRCLGPIFDDVCSGKLGSVQVAPAAESESAPDDQLCVTSLVVTAAPPETQYPEFEREWLND
jgi:hypothetical protein